MQSNIRGDCVQIYELEQVLDRLIVYQINPLQIVDIIYANPKLQSNPIPNWVAKELKSGNNINGVIDYLKQHYKQVLWADHPVQLGYDIIADGQLFKIKVLQPQYNKFNMTNKELYVSCKHNKNYNVFFIKKQADSTVGYIAQDFYSILDIEHKNFINKTNMHSNPSISMISVNYEMVLEDEYIERLEKVQLPYKVLEKDA